MEIKIILRNNFGHLGSEYQHRKKPCNSHTPKVQGREYFHNAAPSLAVSDQHGVCVLGIPILQISQ